MGASRSKPDTVDASALEPGDVVLFTEKTGRFFYNVRYCTWIGYSFAAFVVSANNGKVQLCGHFPTNERPIEGHIVSYRELQSELASGKYDAVYVRKLVTRPTQEAVKAIRLYADGIVDEYAALFGRDDGSRAVSVHSIRITHSDEEVAILMAVSDTPKNAFARLRNSCHHSPVEHFTTSRLVADMLVEAGLLTGEGHIYTAQSGDERLLSPVQELEFESEKKVKYSFRAVMNNSGKRL